VKGVHHAMANAPMNQKENVLERARVSKVSTSSSSTQFYFFYSNYSLNIEIKITFST
jgi:hypothetical protein